MEGLTVISNNVPRDVLDGYELTAVERAEFGYIDWDKIEAGEDSASFVRYKEQVLDLGEFMARGASSTIPLGWDGYMSDTYFSGVLVRYVPGDNYETVVMGRYYY